MADADVLLLRYADDLHLELPPLGGIHSGGDDEIHAAVGFFHCRVSDLDVPCPAVARVHRAGEMHGTAAVGQHLNAALAGACLRRIHHRQGPHLAACHFLELVTKEFFRCRVYAYHTAVSPEQADRNWRMINQDPVQFRFAFQLPLHLIACGDV